MAAQSPISPATQQLAIYGLIFGGAALVGKMMIDNFVGEVQDKKARSAFIGPIWEAPPTKTDPFHARASDGVKFVVMAVSIYQLIAKVPTLVSEWGDVEKQLNTLNQ